MLRAMNRGYTREQYLDLIRTARQIVPGIVFTSDVIVGFPGETREDFEQTLDLVRQVGFVSLYTFIFSPREGTPAAKMPDPIPAEEKSRWFRELTALQEELSASRLAGLVGSVHTAPARAGGRGGARGQAPRKQHRASSGRGGPRGPQG